MNIFIESNLQTVEKFVAEVIRPPRRSASNKVIERKHSTQRENALTNVFVESNAEVLVSEWKKDTLLIAACSIHREWFIHT